VSEPEQVQVGRIVKPHGIRGEVAVDVTSDVAGRFAPGDVIASADGRTFTIDSSRPHQGRLLVKFAEVADRNGAELLRGVTLVAEPADVSGDEYFYAHELIDMLVIHEDGRFLGFVKDLVELPAAAGYDLLEVAREDGSTWLLPATDDYVEVHTDADGEDLLVLVDPPEGLVDAAGVDGS
jgi:16S rRNA processing protein RimM